MAIARALTTLAGKRVRTRPRMSTNHWNNLMTALAISAGRPWKPFSCESALLRLRPQICNGVHHVGVLGWTMRQEGPGRSMCLIRYINVSKCRGMGPGASQGIESEGIALSARAGSTPRPRFLCSEATHAALPFEMQVVQTCTHDYSLASSALTRSPWRAEGGCAHA